MLGSDGIDRARPLVSLVVVSYEMQRELPRTIRSLSPAMQRGVVADEYELLIVDNGSGTPVDEEACASHGARLRWLSVEEPGPSPAAAINLGLAEARADLVGVMIDGARLASPGIIAHALRASRLSARAVIATLGFHLGHDLQRRAIATGYDRKTEDDLLETIRWTEDGYRLFGASVFAGSSKGGWFRTPDESNALFMAAEMWRELRGYDERFRSPGGGLVNLDTFSRALDLPGAELIVLLGEGTFHQIHGGTATNSPMPKRAEFHAEYEYIRGGGFRTPVAQPTLLGTPSDHALPSIANSAGAPGPRPAGNRTIARRYIKLLKQALLNEPGIEAEAAYLYAADAAGRGEAVDQGVGNDVRKVAAAQLREVRRARRAGRYIRNGVIGFSYTMVGRARLNNVDVCVSKALFEHVPGDLVECGVWRGGASILMRGILAAWDVRDRTVWLADSFAGLPPSEHPKDDVDLSPARRPELSVSQERVAENFKTFDLLDGQVRFLPGYFKDTLPDAPMEQIAVLRLDGDLYESTFTSLEALYDRVSAGGFVIADDYGAMPPCRDAVDAFRRERGITEPLNEVDWTGVYWRKSR